MAVLSDFTGKFGPFALVTGASSGIGAEFARQLAQLGLSVVLVARRQERLTKLAGELESKHHIRAIAIVADLSTQTGVSDVIEKTLNLDIGLFVNNAGMEQAGAFLLHDEEQHRNLLQLNIIALTTLTHAIGRRMVVRGGGGIIFVSSLARNVLPWMTIYSASKAFVSSLALTLREEFRGSKIQVMAFEPGLVVSEMSDRISSRVNFTKFGFRTLSVSRSVRTALESFRKGKIRETPGFMYKLFLFSTKILPTRAAMRLKGIMMGQMVDPDLKMYPATELQCKS